MVEKLFNNLYFLRFLLIFKRIQLFVLGEKKMESRYFKKCNGYDLNLDNPQTLNEKTAWLKINYLQDYYYKSCDKYFIHDYLKEKLGYDYAPSLYFVTQNPKELNCKNITRFPCIIKVSNGSGSNLIVRSNEQYSEDFLQSYFSKHLLLSDLHTIKTLEHQYESGTQYIVVEELLQDSNGGIPNDYKFLYINGELEFVYCSVDRLGANVRQIYDKDWNRLHFIWVENANETIYEKYDSSASIAKPKNFEKMYELSSKLAQDYPLVRIDFYETDNSVYIGEITLHHGSGHDRFYPESYDLLYGKKLRLPQKNRL